MGILGDIGTGILIGEGVTNVVVKYSKSQYQEKIDKLDACARKLEKHLSNLQGYKEQLKNIWDDEGAERYHKNLDKEIKSVRNAQDNTNNQIQLWQKAIKEMEDTVKEQQEKIDLMKQALESLNIKD